MNNMIEKSASIVQIDEHNLDKECIRLPQDYLSYAHLAADAKNDVDEAKAKVDVVHAELGQKIRADPGSYGLEKVTETAVSSTIVTRSEYQKAEKALREAKHAHEMAQAVVWALEHKKRSLTLLVELHGTGYFSTPKLSKKGVAAVEEMSKQKARKRVDWDD
jgi:hypothetical protein